MNKTAGWRKRLHEYLEDLEGETFSPGEFDCFTFTVDCLEAITQESIDNPFSGEYQTEEEAHSILEKNGGYEGVAQEIFEENLEIKVINTNYLKKGDPVIMSGSDRNLGFGINLIGGVGVPSLESGIEKVSREHIVSGWAL